MAIRQTSAFVIVPSVVTGSAHVLGDVIGDKFEIPLAAGIAGGWIGTMNWLDRASGNTPIRSHLFNDEPSGYSPTGIPFVLADVDEDKYLGFVDAATWSSAGTPKMIAQARNPGVAIFASGGARNIWSVTEDRGGVTFGDETDPLRVKMTVIQDTDR